MREDRLACCFVSIRVTLHAVSDELGAALCHLCMKLANWTVRHRRLVVFQSQRAAYSCLDSGGRGCFVWVRAFFGFWLQDSGQWRSSCSGQKAKHTLPQRCETPLSSATSRQPGTLLAPPRSLIPVQKTKSCCLYKRSIRSMRLPCSRRTRRNNAATLTCSVRSRQQKIERRETSPRLEHAIVRGGRKTTGN